MNTCQLQLDNKVLTESIPVIQYPPLCVRQRPNIYSMLWVKQHHLLMYMNCALKRIVSTEKSWCIILPACAAVHRLYTEGSRKKTMYTACSYNDEIVKMSWEYWLFLLCFVILKQEYK